LAGKHPYPDYCRGYKLNRIVGAKAIYDACINEDTSLCGWFVDKDGNWYVDVLDDGTAITYCAA
jgi:hypothetical protein